MEWNNGYGEELAKKMKRNLERAAIHLTNEIKKAINRSQPYSISHGDSGIFYHGEDPSLPGEAPKKIRGDLQRSIAYEVASDGQSAMVGSNLDYARYLELGTSKMEVRPFLRATLDKQRDRINTILGS